MSDDANADQPTEGSATGGSTSRRTRFPLKAVEALFHGALERPTGSLRESWLRNAAGADEDLLEQVRELLAAHETSMGFLETSPLLELGEDDVLAAETASVDVEVGSTLGPYTLTEMLGEGGFGVVYRAEQTEPVKREVALKVIKLGMDTRQVIARFEAERQALARLDHPSIARVLDAGQTEGGRPFFVMDLVPGEDLTRFCDNVNMGVRERCELFLDLCSAVQHAHQRGIIHRDLKPSNVLVAEGEGRALPRVIDFGIAKATSDEVEPSQTLRTELGQVIGTPVYMSPEQALGQADIDTRSDVYSLGVILYELLCGRTPVSSRELRDRAVAGELASFLEDHEPAMPSSALMTGRDPVTLSTCRGGTAAEVRSAVRGDLDFIARKALEFERDRRYESAAELARDVKNSLENRPIQARPPSAIYRTRKFFRRHRIAAGASAAVLIAIIGGLVVAFDAQRARQNQADVITSVFTAATETRGSSRTVDAVQKRAENAFGADHPIVVDALSTHAARLERAGEIDGAMEARRRVLDVAQRAHGSRSAEVKFARSALGMQLARTGDPEGAALQLEQAIELDVELDPPGTPYLNVARLELARLALEEGDLVRAASLAESADRIAKALAPLDRRMRADALQTLIEVRTRAGEDSEARRTWNDLFRVLDQLSTPQSTALPRERIRCGKWLASVGNTGEAALELLLALDALRRIEGAPRELEYQALRSFNQVASSARVPRQRLAAEIEREFELVNELFERGTGPYHEALRVLADRHQQRGEVALELARLMELYRSLSGAVASVDVRRQLARQLGERAVALRTVEGLDEDDFRIGCDAVAVSLEFDEGDPALLMAQVELLARAGERLRVFRLVEELENRDSFDKGHPVFLAVKAVAYTSSPAHERKAKTYLDEATALSLSPEFLSVPGLQRTLRWARSIVEEG